MKNFQLFGAAVGFVFFMIVCFLPALVYGGYAGLLLAGGIFGTPVPPSFMARGLVVFGMILGVTGVMSLCLVAGAALGSLFRMLFVNLIKHGPSVLADEKLDNVR